MSAPALSAALAAEGLVVRFGGFAAVAGVDLTVAPGSRHALIGPNGAGKTTLVHALTGAVRAAAGRVLLGGRDVTGVSQGGRVRAGLGRTFQVNQLFRRQTVLANVLLAVFERERRSGVFWRGVAADQRATAEAREHLRFVNLPHLADETVERLPYGQQRVLEIAVALATRPRVLILDEPAAGVPAAESAAIFERLDALPRDLALLFVEHDMGLVFRFAERITVLVGGAVLAEGTPDAIRGDERVREVYLGRRGRAA